MDWKVGQRVKWWAQEHAGIIDTVSENYITIKWDDGLETRYSKDCPEVLPYDSVVEPQPAEPKPPAPEEPRPCQHHYYGFKNERCTCRQEQETRAS